MAQGDFTKQEAEQTIEAVMEMFKAIPKKKSFEYVGHLNDTLLFLESCKHNCPEEKKDNL